MSKSLRHTVSIRLILALVLTATTTGCGRPWLNLGRGGGTLQVTSNVDEATAVLRGNFQTGLYRLDSSNQVTVVLIDGPVESPDQAVTIRMLWPPHAGRTPVEETATNATVHYVIFPATPAEQVGIYSGAGYLFPSGDPGGSRMQADLWQATLKLDVATDGFRDLLGSATLEGRVKARRDDTGTSRTLRRIQQYLHQMLGYPRQVMGEPAASCPQEAKLLLVPPSG